MYSTCHKSLNTDENKKTSFLTGQKRKQCSLRAQVYDISSLTSRTDAAQQHLPISAGEEDETPVRKRRRTDSFEKMLSLKFIKWSSSSSSEQARTPERYANGKPNDYLTMYNCFLFTRALYIINTIFVFLFFS